MTVQLELQLDHRCFVRACVCAASAAALSGSLPSCLAAVLRMHERTWAWCSLSRTCRCVSVTQTHTGVARQRIRDGMGHARKVQALPMGSCFSSAVGSCFGIMPNAAECIVESAGCPPAPHV